MRFEPGQLIDSRYEVLSVLGAGGMGQVYVVRHRYLDRREALKVLIPDLSGSRDVVERFIREAKAASSLRHENIIDVHDFAVLADGSPYYTMERLEGEDLGVTLAREGPLPWARVRHLILQVCRAMAAAHAKGIIHRDLKPANLFRITRGDDPDFIKVLDFGIAKFLAATTITGEGMGPGSPYYMAPEQVQAQPLDPRVDVYALGVVLFELLSGALPFEADTVWALIYAIQHTEPRPLGEVAPDVSPEVEALVARAMAKDREQRFESVEALAAAIAAIEEAPARRRPSAPAGRPPSPVDGMADTAASAPIDLRETDQDEPTRLYARDPPGATGGDPTIIGIGVPPPVTQPRAVERVEPRRRARPRPAPPPPRYGWMIVTMVVFIGIGVALVVYRQSRTPPKQKPTIEMTEPRLNPSQRLRFPDPAPEAHEGKSSTA